MIYHAEFTATTLQNATHLRADIKTATLDDAQALAAKFPKSARVKATTLWTGDQHVGLVHIDVSLEANGTTGAHNETGLKRWQAFKRTLAAIGIELRYLNIYKNRLAEADALAIGN